MGRAELQILKHQIRWPRMHRCDRPLQADTLSEETLLEALLELDVEGYQLEGENQAVVHVGCESLEALQDGLRDQG